MGVGVMIFLGIVVFTLGFISRLSREASQSQTDLRCDAGVRLGYRGAGPCARGKCSTRNQIHTLHGVLRKSVLLHQ